MKVFKFGGASVKDAAAIRNVERLIREYAPKELVAVVSAMGKTTNALENVLQCWYAGNGHAAAALDAVKDFHRPIIRALFPEPEHPVFGKVRQFFQQLETVIAQAPSGNYDSDYDRVVSTGELVASIIIGEYLNAQGIACHWLDARRVVVTDFSWREGHVDWDATEKAIRKNVLPMWAAAEGQTVILTQGFIGGTADGCPTTLGREGSDYTAAIFSYALDADEMWVWKDVEGVRNADPKLFADTVLLSAISYGEAIELTYYGASVIHPKTIRPLRDKNILLRVRSFLAPEKAGTVISGAVDTDRHIPSFIIKTNQWLVSIAPKNFSFIAEENLRDLFAAFAQAGIHINMMQHAAISFTACFTEDARKTEKLFALLHDHFTIKYNTRLQLLTIRHWTPAALRKMTAGKTILLEQRNRTTAQMVMAEEERPKNGGTQ